MDRRQASCLAAIAAARGATDQQLERLVSCRYARAYSPQPPRRGKRRGRASMSAKTDHLGEGENPRDHGPEDQPDSAEGPVEEIGATVRARQTGRWNPELTSSSFNAGIGFLRLAKLAAQPGASHSPVPLHRLRRNIESAGDFLHGHSRKKAHLHNAPLPLVQQLQLT